MIKKVFFFIFAFLLVSFQVEAQEFSELDKSPMDMIEFPSSISQTNKLARILYSRPQLRGRDVSTLVPDGKLWRLGANEATELTLYSDMKLNDKSIPAGSYTLYAIPAEKKMTLHE